jgi:hypothetical protein
VKVVQREILNAGRGKGHGQFRLPDPLREPYPFRNLSEIPPDGIGQLLDLPPPIPLREEGHHRLVHPAAQDLDLPAGDEFPEKVENVRAVFRDP